MIIDFLTNFYMYAFKYKRTPLCLDDRDKINIVGYLDVGVPSGPDTDGWLEKLIE